MASKRTNCIVPECGREATGNRRMCQGCYQAARRMVNAGDTSWEELERRKLAGPDGRKDAPPRTALAKALAKK